MPAVNQSVNFSIGTGATPFNKNLVLTHDDGADITLAVGGAAKDLSGFLGVLSVGSCTLLFLSQPTALTPYTPAPFIVTINGVALQVDDLALLNLSAVPTTLTLSLPASAVSPVTVRFQAAGQ